MTPIAAASRTNGETGAGRVTWPVVPLCEVLTHNRDYVNEPEPREYPKLSVKLYGKGVVMDAPADGSSLKMKRHQLAKPGQVILSEIWGKKGAIGFVPDEGEGALCTSHFFLFDVDHTKVESGWLQAVFTANYLESQLGDKAFGTTGYAAVRPKNLLAATIPLPPLEEQRRIVAKIEHLAAKIDEAHGLRFTASDAADAFIVSSRAAAMGETLAKGTKPITEAAVLERGKFTHRPRNDPRFFGGDHPWIQIGEIESAGKHIESWTQTLNDEGLAISRKFPAGTLLVSIAATIGAVGILGFDCCVPDSIVAVTPYPENDSEFLYYYLAYLRTNLEEIAPQSAQKNINLRILSALPFPDVSKREQRRIVTYLDSLQAKVSRLKALQQKTAAELDALLPAILDKAFKGEL